MLTPCGHPLYVVNQRRYDFDVDSCIYCGRPIRNPKTAQWVTIGDGNCRFLLDGEETDDSGAFPIGPACYQKLLASLPRGRRLAH